MAVDPLELRLVSALERYDALQRRASTHGDSSALTQRALTELGTTLETVRAAQEQLVACRRRVTALQAELEAERAKYWRLFNEVPEAYVIARADTTILDVNRAGAELFNVSQRFLVGKALSIFVCEDRPHLLEASVRVAQHGEPEDLKLKIRPRERAPLAIDARVRGDNGSVQWILRPEGLQDRSSGTNGAGGADRGRRNGRSS
jgi:PAS domain S-box-containing protein